MNNQARCELAAYILAGIALLLILKAKLLAALLGGLLAHELLHSFAPNLGFTGTSLHTRKVIVLLLLITAIGVLATGAGIGLATLTARGPDSVVALMQKMADLIEGARGHLPAWVQDYVPGTAEELQASASTWLRTHARELRSFGENFGRGLVHVVVGIIIGSLVAFSRAPISAAHQPLAAALLARTTQLGQSFRRLVFAQIRISALNTVLTGLYLAVLLPLCGVHLPLIKTMIAVTFMLGLLPLVGNLLSNTVIVVVALSHSLGAAAGSLAYLVTIHKLEYFVNAQIIGTQMRARAWELLTAMLVMEAVFGLPGLVAAPIYYGYMKAELAAKRLV